MLRTKKLLCNLLFFCGLVLAAVGLTGCGEPGPKALQEGDRFVQAGHFAEAVGQLKIATAQVPISTNAPAWNVLGLAYHGNQQPVEALKAYQKALLLDYKLAEPHFNLGCLYLEQNKPVEAVDELVTFTALKPKVADGWLKLATAQWRLRRLDAAEKSFKTALALQTRNPEAWNGLGLIALQRKRPLDAQSAFHSALAQQSNYAPALLNLAVVAHQHLNNRSVALQQYRDYLALKPRPANWELVEATAHQLELELTQPARPLTNAPAQTAPKTNPPAAGTNLSLVVTQKNISTGAVAKLLERASPPAATNGIKAAPATTTASTPVGTGKSTPIEVTRLPEELKVKTPQDNLAASPQPGTKSTELATPTDPAPTLVAKSNPETQATTNKPGFFKRLIPFRSKPKTEKASEPSLNQKPSRPVTQMAAITNSVTPENALPAAPPPMPRYAYQAPPKPTPGNRNDAERFFVQGLKAQREGRRLDAISAYRAATKSDPAYFDAYYNLGLAAYEIGDWKQSLSAYENALAVSPESLNARYNFALALREAKFPLDAAGQWELVLDAKPAETRAHLALANLYAQQLNDRKRAREHYLKVLELEPAHPQAATIRYWLAGNP
jgi:tetratricopeptide (TPR) repeat protein